MRAETALHLATELRDALRDELAQAEIETGLLAGLALEDLLRRAGARQVFNARAARLQADLATALGGNAAPASSQAVFRELRDLAQALKKRDATNLSLAQRTLGYVRAYLSFLSPKPSAYDRRGHETDSASLQASVSGRA